MRGSIRKRARQGGVVYQVRVDLGLDQHGQRRQASRTYRTRKEAEAGLAAWLSEIARGTAIDPTTATVGDVLRAWFEATVRGQRKANTVQMYEQTLRLYLLPRLGDVQAQKLTPARVERLYADLRAAGVGARTIQLCHIRLRQALTWARRMQLVPRNVTDDVTAPLHRARRMAVWSEEEARRFLDAARAQARYGPIWPLLLGTGLRLGEMQGLRWADLDWAAARLHVRRTSVYDRTGPRAVTRYNEPKSAAGHRTVPLPAPLVVTLRAWRAEQAARRLALGAAYQDSDLVFPTHIGTPLLRGACHRDYEHVRAAAEVPDIGIHNIRHTFATHALARGMPVGVLSEILGHSKISVTMDVYVHVLRAHRAAAAGYIEQAFF